jgi:hypothetical protein
MRMIHCNLPRGELAGRAGRSHPAAVRFRRGGFGDRVVSQPAGIARTRRGGRRRAGSWGLVWAPAPRPSTAAALPPYCSSSR